MYYHLYRNMFYHQLLSAIQAEVGEEELPRSELDSAVIAERSDTIQSSQRNEFSSSKEANAKPYQPKR